jgi:hypothetical protein
MPSAYSVEMSVRFDTLDSTAIALVTLLNDKSDVVLAVRVDAEHKLMFMSAANEAVTAPTVLQVSNRVVMGTDLPVRLAYGITLLLHTQHIACAQALHRCLSTALLVRARFVRFLLHLCNSCQQGNAESVAVNGSKDDAMADSTWQRCV